MADNILVSGSADTDPVIHAKRMLQRGIGFHSVCTRNRLGGNTL